ncbi:MAG: serine/threonine protein kinase [Anaerolineae bacterium]|nr:serine/threonine protein kinase [Anaerolineae bacterium]
MENDSLVNKRLGKYLIQKELGRGGMAVVYLAYDPTLERTVAVKVLAPHLIWQQDFIDRFLREARSAAQLRHPNIVTIFDVGQESGWHYFVMEYLEGTELTKYIRERGALSSGEIIAILRPLAEALDYAHRQGLIHRDIKPGNIMIDSEGQAKLTDFGIARASSDTRLTSTGTIMGTPEYMSPEQAQGLTVDTRTDQYSLAVVAYEMLSGTVPFKADSTMALLYKVTHEPPPPISDTRPDLPEGVGDVLEKALAKEPGARFESVMAFISALERALLGQKVKPVAVVPTPQPEKTRKGIPAWVWVLSGLALLSLIGGCALLLLGYSFLTPDATPPPSSEVGTKPTETSVAPSLGGANLTINNQSPYNICYVYISPEDSESWGEDQLGDQAMISPGESRSFEMDPGTYDVLLKDCAEIPVESESGISQSSTITVGGPDMVALLLDNQTSSDVWYVNISPSTNDNWGADWLGGVETIASGDQRIFYVPVGTYDLRALDGDSNTLVEETNVSLMDDVTTWTLSD